MIDHKPKAAFEDNAFWKGIMLGTLVAFFGFLGLSALSTAPQTDTTDAMAAPPVVQDETVTFTLGTRLGTGQVQETLEVYINDEYVGDLYIDTNDPVDSLQLEVPAEGIHEYRINSVTKMEINGEVVSNTGKGTGTLDIQQGDHFSAYYSNATRIWQMSFKEE